MFGPSPVMWTIPTEQRSPAEVDRIVRAHIRWRVVDGRLLPVEATVRGRVMQRGASISGADVALSFETIPYRYHVATDADGHFELSDLRDGKYTIGAMSPDRLAGGVHVVQLHGEDVTADVELDLEGTIAGSVTDDHGQPVPGAHVHAICCHDADSGDAVTDAGGQFTVGTLLGGATYAVTVQSDGLDNVPPAGAAIPVRDRTDHMTGVQLVVRRIAKAP